VNGIELIAAERARQVEVEGFSTASDKFHRNSELALLACYYAMPGELELRTMPEMFFPPNWRLDWAKRDGKSRIQQLVCAGALIAAEIDRLQTANTKEG